MIVLVSCALFPLGFSPLASGARGGKMRESRSGASRDVGSIADSRLYARPHGESDLLGFPVTDLFSEPLDAVNAFVSSILFP